jgi:hypothetical protein
MKTERFSEPVEVIGGAICVLIVLVAMLITLGL